MKKIVLAAAPLALLAFAAGTADAQRPARCVVENSGATFRGPCLFGAERGGSFWIRPARGDRFFRDAMDVSVTIMSPGVADVRGLTEGGLNSRWGEARRSPRDRACWIGDHFRVCAY